MGIHILSGTCLPSLDRYPSYILIRFQGLTVHGPGTMGQLLKLRWKAGKGGLFPL